MQIFQGLGTCVKPTLTRPQSSKAECLILRHRRHAAIRCTAELTVCLLLLLHSRPIASLAHFLGPIVRQSSALGHANTSFPSSRRRRRRHGCMDACLSSAMDIPSWSLPCLSCTPRLCSFIYSFNRDEVLHTNQAFLSGRDYRPSTEKKLPQISVTLRPPSSSSNATQDAWHSERVALSTLPGCFCHFCACARGPGRDGGYQFDYTHIDTGRNHDTHHPSQQHDSLLHAKQYQRPAG